MNKLKSILIFAIAVAIAGCSSSVTAPRAPAAPPLPPPSNNGTVPAAISAVSGYKISVFAPPTSSTKPDSIVQIGKSIFVGYGDTVGPDGTPGAGGVSQVEIQQFDLTGKLQKTFEVPGHNDGLMAFDNNTLWAMSNEDSNAKLVIINISTGSQQVYTPQASLVNGTGGLPHGGGLDDMVMIGGKVFVSASNPSVDTTSPCPADSSTPACPNGINTGSFVYTLTLNNDGATFNLTPVMASGTTAKNLSTNANGTFNITDPDSEVVSADGSTLIVDGQGDSELAFISNPGGASPTMSYLPLGALQVDDTRFVPSGPTFLLLTDTPSNAIYRIDGAFNSGEAYGAGQTALVKLNSTTGSSTSIVSGLQAAHGLLFVTPQ